MASGFVQRYKGKITAGALYQNNWQLFGPDSVNSIGSSIVTVSTLGVAPYQGSITNIMATDTSTHVFTLAPPLPGLRVSLALLQVTAGVFIRASTINNCSFAAGSTGTITSTGSTNIVMKSTVPMTINLIGLSSNVWGLAGWYSTSTGGAGLGPIFSGAT